MDFRCGVPEASDTIFQPTTQPTIRVVLCGLPVTAEVASSSLVVPAILSKELTESAPFSRGHKIGTGNRVFPSRAYVCCVFSRNKSATTASCAFRFSVVAAFVRHGVSCIDRISTAFCQGE